MGYSFGLRALRWFFRPQSASHQDETHQCSPLPSLSHVLFPTLPLLTHAPSAIVNGTPQPLARPHCTVHPNSCALLSVSLAVEHLPLPSSAEHCRLAPPHSKHPQRQVNRPSFGVPSERSIAKFFQDHVVQAVRRNLPLHLRFQISSICCATRMLLTAALDAGPPLMSAADPLGPSQPLDPSLLHWPCHGRR